MLKNIENWHQYLLYKFRMSNSDPLIFHCKNKVVAEVPRRLLHTFKEIFFEECYTKCLPKYLFQDSLTIIDIGANAGYFALYMLSRYPGSHIIAFEPIPKNFELLAQNRKHNPMQNLTVVNKAVYGKPGRITLSYDAEDSFTTTGSIFLSEVGHDKIEVETITLPGVFQAYALDRIDLLKMDCEGAEYHILYNCPREYLDCVSSIAMEVHKGQREGENKSELCEYLRSVGYKLRTDRGDMVWGWRDRKCGVQRVRSDDGVRAGQGKL